MISNHLIRVIRESERPMPKPLVTGDTTLAQLAELLSDRGLVLQARATGARHYFVRIANYREGGGLTLAEAIDDALAQIDENV